VHYRSTLNQENNLQLTSPSRAHFDEFINERVGEVLIQLEVIVFKYILVNITEYCQSDQVLTHTHYTYARRTKFSS